MIAIASVAAVFFVAMIILAYFYVQETDWATKMTKERDEWAKKYHTLRDKLDDLVDEEFGE